MKNLNVLFVGGTWDKDKGRSSRYVETISNLVEKKITGHIDVFNGGNANDLKKMLDESSKDYNVVFWFPNIPSELRRELSITNPKFYNPYCILVNYRRNNYEKFTYDELKSSNIKHRADITCEVRKDDNGRYQMRVFDSNLDTIISDFTNDLNVSITELISRIYTFKSLRYTKLTQSDEEVSYKVPDYDKILDAYIDFGEFLSEKIGNDKIKRHLGDMAYRGYIDDKTVSNDVVCTNIKKIELGELNKTRNNPFVPTKILMNEIKYYGNSKPCANVATFNKVLCHLPNVNYVFFSKTYITDAPYTEKILPSHCGQAATEILTVIETHNYKSNFAVNLLGCGSMIFVKSLNELEKYKELAVKREAPELILPEYSQVTNDDGSTSFINVLNNRVLMQNELLDIRFNDGTSSVYKISVNYYKDTQGRTHKEAYITMTIKGTRTDVPILGLYARRV